MNTIRESIKQKMLDALPNKMVEVTAPELSYVLRNPDAMAEIIAEVEAAKKQATEWVSKASDFLTRGQKDTNIETGIGVKCCDQTEAPKPLTFEEAAKPLMSYIAEHFDSDETIALVGPGGAELVTTVRSIFRD